MRSSKMGLKILDGYCGQGGAAEGLHRYWPDAEITGCDIVEQPRYPFRFIQSDFFEMDLSSYDFIWTSPPCQGYSTMRHLPWLRDKTYPLLIAPTRERLAAWGGPYIIESVAGAMREMPGRSGKYLCGTMFGKQFYRHRLFESNFMWLSPPHPKHMTVIQPGHSLAGRARDIIFSAAAEDRRGGLTLWRDSAGQNGLSLVSGHQPGALQARIEMGVEWMDAYGCSQAIPPCYSEYLAQWIPVG